MIKQLRKVLGIFIVALSMVVASSHAHAYDSLLEIDSVLKSRGNGSFFTFNDCFSTGQVIFNTAETNQIAMLEVFSEAGIAQYNQASQANSNNVIIAAATRAVAYRVLGAMGGAGTAVAFLAAGVDYAVMSDICSNAFVVPAHELMNSNLNCLKCSPIQGSQFLYKYLHAYGPEDIPYRFHCDTSSTIDGYYTRGYGGYYNDVLCNSISTSQSNWGWSAQDIGKIHYCYTPAITKLWNSLIARHTYIFCDGTDGYLGQASSAANCSELSAGDAGNGKRVYYRKDPDSGSVQQCVANLVTLMPVLIGCVTTAPPVETAAADQNLINYMSDTRCSYLMSGRKDLSSLGQALPAIDQSGSGAPNYSMKAFLQGEFHIFSTMTGCIKDMLSIVVVGSKTTSESSFNQSFLQQVQDAFKPIVYATIALALIVMAINIIIAGQEPKAADIILFLVKIAVVIYLATGSFWYNQTNTDPNSGLYGKMLSVSESIASLFMSAVANYDPVGRCSYIYQGSQLLSERDLPATAPSNVLNVVGPKLPDCIPSAGNPYNWASSSPPARGNDNAIPVTANPAQCGGKAAVNTHGGQEAIYALSKVVDPNGCGPDSVDGQVCQSLKYLIPSVAQNTSNLVYQTEGAYGDGGSCVVRMTIWDMLDCRFANILNMGQCRFTIASMMMIWIIPIALFSSITLALATFITLFCLLTVTIKFILTFIMSLFAITFLVVASPIFVLFLLFKPTAQIFQNWMSYMLGYLIYPGVLFAYIALMMTTLNVVMFGDLTDAITYVESQASKSTNPIHNSGGPVSPKLICIPGADNPNNNLDPAANAAFQRAANTLFCQTYFQLGLEDPCAAFDTDVTTKFLSTQTSALFSFTSINQSYVQMAQSAMINLMMFAILFNMLSTGIASFIANLCGVQQLDFSNQAGIADRISATGIARRLGAMQASGLMKAAKAGYNKFKNGQNDRSDKGEG